VPKKVWNRLQYSEADEALLIRMFNEYNSLADIGLAMGRSEDSIAKKVNRMGLKRNSVVVAMVTKYGLDILDSLDLQGPHITNKCTRGHEFTPENTYPYTCKKSGRKYRQCKACRKLRPKLQYRKDAEFREKMKARSKRNRILRALNGTNAKRTDTEPAA